MLVERDDMSDNNVHEPRRFWVVIREDDNRLRRHETLEAAQNEAERLVRQEHKGFYVATVFEKCRPVLVTLPVEWAHTYEGPVHAG